MIHLLPIGAVDQRQLETLRSRISKQSRLPCDVLQQAFTPDFAYHAERQQYHSSEILARMQQHVRPGCWRMLGITSADLYIPILTFVFGEAQLGGTCALVSTHRLTQEFYGLPPDRDLLMDRLLKESIHELGHTVELTHCDDYRCVMAPSHAVEWIDLKESYFCPECESRVIGARR
ncbi:MAG TPA: archaemetzincin family Zn-dependent metalloprotease [Terriglobales bacterium]|nr:archaemetzincin family Zn-dependent metalloprotease [Terriglobales bacterium]